MSIYNHSCTLCPLHSNAQTVCMEASPGICKAMILGEAPGKSEDARGEPFVGQSGRLLMKTLVMLNCSRDDFYISNAVKCRPPENRNPTERELIACYQYLHAELKSYKIKHVLVLGNVAGDFLIGGWRGVTQDRGQWYHQRGVLWIPTYHPAYILRKGTQSEEGELFFQDVREFVTKVKNGV